jgi:transcriptional regulator with XRE-family HTH domain
MASERGRWGDTLVEALEEAVEWTRGERNDLLVVRYSRRGDGMVVREESRGGTVLREEVLPAGSLPPVDTDPSDHVEGPPAYFGFQIADIRAKLGLSRELFARLLGSSVSSVSAWEQGRREPPGAARRLLQIADADPDLVRQILLAPPQDAPEEARPPRALATRIERPVTRRAVADTQG